MQTGRLKVRKINDFLPTCQILQFATPVIGNNFRASKCLCGAKVAIAKADSRICIHDPKALLTHKNTKGEIKNGNTKRSIRSSCKRTGAAPARHGAG